MKRIKRINNVTFLEKANNLIAYSIKNGISAEICILMGLDEECCIPESVFRIFGGNNFFVYQNKEGSGLKVYKNREIFDLLQDEVYINQAYSGQIIVSIKRSNGYDDFLLDDNLKLIKLQFYPNYIFGDNYIESLDGKTISAYYDDRLLWEINTRNLGHRTSLSTGASIPNELGGELLSYAHLLFVPLEGGQLLALDSRTGEQVWMLNDEISGRYVVYNNLIYKKNLRFIQEIDALTGKVLRKVNIKTPPLYPDLYPSGPFWVYTDMIILTDILEGKVLLLDRLSLSVIDYIEISCRLANATNILIRDSQRLYVHDLSNTLHVFELE